MEQAAVQLKILSDAHPNNWSVITDYGYVLREIGRIKEAKCHYENALKINYEYPGAHNNLGFLLLHDLGDIDKAHHHFMMALKFDSEFGMYALKVFANITIIIIANPYRHLGDLYRIENDKQDFEAAKMFYSKSLEMRKNYKEALHGLQVLYLLEMNVIKSENERKELNVLEIDEEKLKAYQQYLQYFDVNVSLI